MSHFKSNLRDIEFNLFEVFKIQDYMDAAAFSGFDQETATETLKEIERISREDIADSLIEADRTPPVFDPATNTAPVPAAFKKAYDAYMESGFWAIGLPEEIGCQPAPATVVWSAAEMILGANAPLYMYSAGPFFASVVFHNANGVQRDIRIAELMVEKQWGATMVLTEPDAGSDVGAGKTFATDNGDGTWNISGVKRFITSAESDLQENIMHLVLARPKGIEGVGGPGTKGLSLFLVSKYHFDLETGELGARNGAYVTNVEHKMGIKASNTCEVTFGDPQIGGGEPAVGYLLGEVHDGIRQMFDVIENARMLVGTKAIGTLSTGYLNALEYAKQRVQGPDLSQAADKNAPKVTITHHPDVRRSLMTQKSYAEAMRALYVYTAYWKDQVLIGGENAELAAKINDLLLPIVKGYGSEKAWTLLGTESLQTLGGSGFLQEYPIEQYIRDAKIDTLYEGTTAIQGMDFFFRKIVKDQGTALGHLQAEIQATVDNGSTELKVERELLGEGLATAGELVTLTVNDLMNAMNEIKSIYKVGLNTSRVLMALGDVVCAWLLVRQAEVALAALANGASEKDKAFYEGKVAAAKFFTAQVLPKIAAELEIAKATTLDIMELSEDAF
ncbi:acyl-CoA dehydrogenase [Nocardioides jejuensis]|uniref:Broad-specificity linear acyl-CoA dehydrogenase FadE5 n=1 Tax=Nocardioides jejuensis TaxID=2502782 RepID=A0A4R1CFB3_9ACTN|nr:acyl-CoA dehydrogenase [Nocardioides jejuensis]TCJ29850.1 acyl-CoA dehydrogenase [Nocardioides jejuensis]